MKSSAPDSLWAVILAGGVGSRFWPVSTPARPKQLLPLAGSEPLIAQTVARIADLVPPARVRILAGPSLTHPFLNALPHLGRDNFLVEPRARGTAPVLAWAAFEIAQQDPDAVMISLHADHVIEPASEFLTQLENVAQVSRAQQRLFTIGAKPTRPETGYGYIRRGAMLTDRPATFAVERFVEKPDRATAERYVREGYLWNTGIFVLPARLLLEEIERHTPEVATALPLLRQGAVSDFFASVPTLTIDVGVMERSPRVAVAAATFEWDDVGAWDAVARTRDGDDRGNVIVGEGYAVDADECIVWSEDGTVVVFGARDLVVVRSGGLTMVLPRDRAADLKTLLASLPPHVVERGGAS